MDALKLRAVLGLDKSEYEEGLKDSESLAYKAGEGIGSVLNKTAKVVATGIATATAAVGGLVKSSVDSYAEYEQLVGGVETLFGTGGKSLEEYAKSVGKTVDEARGEYEDLQETQSEVLAYADYAYKNAGLSANEYLETVTGMAASLKQSLGGDSWAAAQEANKAIMDMSDNANKMGTSMEMIQNAYAGFSKQNYTMLDNLKLGYGGTKEEMERLLEDAEKISGIEYDVSSYADIVDAIHVVQDEMGITGTTAKEAATTIEGSLAMTKSAWQNLVTGITDPNADIGVLVTNLVDSAGKAAKNLIPAVKQALTGVGELVHELVPIIGETLPSVVEEILPLLLESGIDLFNALVETLPTILDILIQQLPTVIQALVDGIVALLPMLIEVGLQLIMAISDGLIQAIPQLIPAITQMITQLVTMLTEPQNLTKLIMGAVQIILAIATGLIQAIPQLIEAVPTIISNLVQAFIQLVPQLFSAGVELLLNLILGIMSIKETLLNSAEELINGVITTVLEVGLGLFEQGKELVENIINGIEEKFDNIKESGEELIDNIIEGIKGMFGDLVTKGEEIVTNVKDGFSNMVSDAVTWGKDLIDNFISGLKAKWESLKSTVSDIAGSIADYLGFSEPEKGPLSNFHTYAPDMMDLFMEGINDNKHKLLNTVSDVFDFQDLIVSSPLDENAAVGEGDIYTMLSSIVQMLPGLMNNQIVLDTGILVGETANQMNEALGMIYYNEQRSV